MKKIGINAAFLRKPGTGIGQVTLHFLQELISRKFQYIEHEFFLYVEEDPGWQNVPENFHIKVLQPSLYKRDDLIRKYIFEKFLLKRQVKKDKLDSFVSLYQAPTVLPKTIQHVMIVHDLIPSLFSGYLDNMRKKLSQWMTLRGIRKVSKVVTVSEATKQDVIHRLNVPDRHIVAQHIDVDPLFKNNVNEIHVDQVLGIYGLRRGYIYSGGGLELRKNVERVIRAYHRLVMKYRGTSVFVPQLVISGKLMPQLAPLVVDVEKLVQQLHITQEVRILGYVPQEDLPMLYAGAKMFLFPSLYEGFGLPVLEAMNIGTPVITSNKSSLPEVGGGGVLYTDSGSIEDIMEKMEMLLRDEGLREKLIQKAKVQAKKFEYENFVTGVMAHI